MSKELEALKIGIPKLKKLYENSAKKMSSNDILGFDLTFSYLDKALQRLESIDNANPSEALERITSEIIDGYPTDNILVGMTWEEHSAIKQALLKAQEQNEMIVELCEYFGLDNLYPYDDLESIEYALKNARDISSKERVELLRKLNKQKKVLEIIKELKRFGDNVNDILEYDTYEDYINSKWNWSYELTQEKFDLLKRYFNG